VKPGRLKLDAGTRATGDREVAYLAVAGEVDLSNAEELREAVDDTGGNGAGVVIDLTDVGFMDSSGLAVILQAARDRESRLVIVAAPGSAVERLLEMTEAAGRVRLMGSEQQALEALADPDAS